MSMKDFAKSATIAPSITFPIFASSEYIIPVISVCVYNGHWIEENWNLSKKLARSIISQNCFSRYTFLEFAISVLVTYQLIEEGGWLRGCDYERTFSRGNRMIIGEEVAVYDSLWEQIQLNYDSSIVFFFIKIERSRSWFPKSQILISIFLFFSPSCIYFEDHHMYDLLKNLTRVYKKYECDASNRFVIEWYRNRKQSTYLIAVSGLHTTCAREVACRESRWPRTCVCLKFEPTVTYHSRFFFTLLRLPFRKDCASIQIRHSIWTNETNRNHFKKERNLFLLCVLI